MSYVLTTQECATVDSLSYSFWADLRVMVHQDAVLFYVDSYRTDFEYVACLGIYLDPQSVLEAVENYPGYVNRSKVSTRKGVNSLRGYHKTTPEQRTERIEVAIQYWRENQKAAL